MKKIIIVFLFCFFGLGRLDLVIGGQDMKKAVLIIASNGYQDEEFAKTFEELKLNNVQVEIASSSLNPARGMFGGTVKPTMLIRDVDVNNFDALVFIGGSGADEYWDNPVAHKIAIEGYNKNKVIAAICIAPVTLAKSGILKGKRATVFSSESSLIKAEGADYTGKNVEQDGRIITGSGPQAAREFAQTLARELLYK